MAENNTQNHPWKGRNMNELTDEQLYAIALEKRKNGNGSPRAYAAQRELSRRHDVLKMHSNRADIEHVGRIKAVLCSAKYKGLNATQKRTVLEKYFGDLLGSVESVLPYIERTNPTDAAQNEYRRRLTT